MRLLPSIASLLVIATTGCVFTDADSSLLVSNDSSFEIHEIYVTEVASLSWGANLLREDILFPGDSLSLAVDCGTYDAMLVDETDETCEISSIDLCFDDADWVIRDNTCAVFEARAAARKQAATK